MTQSRISSPQFGIILGRVSWGMSVDCIVSCDWFPTTSFDSSSRNGISEGGIAGCGMNGGEVEEQAGRHSDRSDLR